MSASTNEATLRQIKHLLQLLDATPGGATFDLMRRLQGGYFTDLLEALQDSAYQPRRDEMRTALGLLPRNPTLTVDYDLSFEKMVAAGNYDQVMPGLFQGDFLKDWLQDQENGKQVGKAFLRVRLETIARSVDLNTNEAEHAYTVKDRTKIRLATYPELFAFGATYPKLQIRHGSIFGRSYPGPRSFPVRDFHPHLWSAGKRGLSFESGGAYSNPLTTFLFVEVERFMEME